MNETGRIGSFWRSPWGIALAATFMTYAVAIALFVVFRDSIPKQAAVLYDNGVLSKSASISWEALPFATTSTADFPIFVNNATTPGTMFYLKDDGKVVVTIRDTYLQYARTHHNDQPRDDCGENYQEGWRADGECDGRFVEVFMLNDKGSVVIDRLEGSAAWK